MASSLRIGGTTFSFLPLLPGGGTGALIQFRAFITSLSEDNTGNWGESLDMGRATPKFKYQSYSRTMQVAFNTVALHDGEEMEWLNALNSLIELTKPIYDGANGFNGPLCLFTIGNIFKEYGFLTSVGVTVPTDSPWINGIPVVLECNASITVVGEKKPRYLQSGGNLGNKAFGQGKGD